jgi:hypothetical protein
MQSIRVWEGVQCESTGFVNSDFTEVKFLGKELGYWRKSYGDRRGCDYSIFQTSEGLIIIHRVEWSGWSGEDTYGYVYEFVSLDDAVSEFRTVLKNAGVIKL